MAVRPVDYLGMAGRGRPNLGDSILEGLQLRQQRKVGEVQENLLKQKQDQAIQANQRKILAKEKLQGLVKGNITDPVQWAQYYAEHPESAQAADKIASTLRLGQDKSTKNLLLRSKMALLNKSPELASKIYSDRAKAYEDTDPDTAAMYSDLSHSIMANPKNAKALIDMVGFRMLGEEYAVGEKVRSDISKTGAEADKIGAEAREIESGLGLKQKND